MEYQYHPHAAGCGHEDAIIALLTMADKEFIPPLSQRGSSTQSDLSGGSLHAGVMDYYHSMQQQPVILAIEDGKCLGFMAFMLDHTCEQIKAEMGPNLYASTCVVDPATRGKGVMKNFYLEMIRLYPERMVCTRTWHTNAPHLHILDKLGFAEIARLKDHRGPGMDTVYFARKPH
jgi:ribosomal protein S18 acetylase RimI-like enzyme